MFDDVAATYDLTNTLLSFGQDRRWRGIVRDAVDPQSGQKILDLAAGTGASSVAFAKPGVKVIAGDFSKGMLAVGRKRHPEIEFVFADATKLPFKDNEFDAVTISFGLRNVNEPKAALSEMYRVLKPGGKLLVLEFSKVPAALQKPYDLYSFQVLPWLGQKIAGDAESYRYLAESIRMHPDQETLKTMMQDAGLENVQYYNLTAGVAALHTGIKL